MNIKIENNRIQVADISALVNRTLYVVPESKDSVTFIFNDNLKQTVIVDDTTVNGTQMTPDNIDELLSPLFNSTGAGSATNTQSEAYTKLEYSDTLVFPTPQRSGHITEFYKENALYQSYQWDGWNWIIMGVESNLIFEIERSDRYSSSEVLDYFKAEYRKIINDTVYFLLAKGYTNIDYTLILNKIIKSTKDYSLDMLYLIEDETRNIVIEHLKPISFRFECSEQGKYTSWIDNLKLKDIETETFSMDTIVSKNTILDNISIPEGSLTNLSSNNLELRNTITTNLNTKIANLEDSFIIIENNTIKGSLYLEEITGAGSTSLKFLNNSELSEISLSDFTIVSFDANFDKTGILSVNLSYCIFENDTLDALINSLTTKNYPNGNFNYNSTPNLTQQQKTNLTNAGWTLQ